MANKQHPTIERLTSNGPAVVNGGDGLSINGRRSDRRSGPGASWRVSS